MLVHNSSQAKYRSSKPFEWSYLELVKLKTDASLKRAFCSTYVDREEWFVLVRSWPERFFRRPVCLHKALWWERVTHAPGNVVVKEELEFVRGEDGLASILDHHLVQHQPPVIEALFNCQAAPDTNTTSECKVF